MKKEREERKGEIDRWRDRRWMEKDRTEGAGQLHEYVKTLPVLSVINRVLNKTRGKSTCQEKRDVIRRRDREKERKRRRGKMDERMF